MSKAVKALDNIVKKETTSGSTIMDFGYGNSGDYLTVKKALTPPTADEVCEAFNKHYNYNVEYEYDKTFKGFKNKQGTMWGYVCSLMEDGTIRFLDDLPPYLVIMIARFYEGLEE